jgi:hypothetical protein
MLRGSESRRPTTNVFNVRLTARLDSVVTGLGSTQDSPRMLRVPASVQFLFVEPQEQGDSRPMLAEEDEFAALPIAP